MYMCTHIYIYTDICGYMYTYRYTYMYISIYKNIYKRDRERERERENKNTRIHNNKNEASQIKLNPSFPLNLVDDHVGKAWP